jgi:hypothetical protein
MALVLNDRVKVTSTTTGTGAFALGAAATGFETFAQGIGNNNTTYYCIFNQGTTEFETGLGTLDGSSANLTRTAVISSSNSDSAVFCTLPASKTMDMVLTTQGDMPYASAANTPARLALGSAGHILQVNSGGNAPEWAASSGVSSGFVIAMSIAL